MFEVNFNLYVDFFFYEYPAVKIFWIWSLCYANCVYGILRARKHFFFLFSFCVLRSLLNLLLALGLFQDFIVDTIKTPIIISSGSNFYVLCIFWIAISCNISNYYKYFYSMVWFLPAANSIHLKKKVQGRLLFLMFKITLTG